MEIEAYSESCYFSLLNVEEFMDVELYLKRFMIDMLQIII